MPREEFGVGRDERLEVVVREVGAKRLRGLVSDGEKRHFVVHRIRARRPLLVFVCNAFADERFGVVDTEPVEDVARTVGEGVVVRYVAQVVQQRTN